MVDALRLFDRLKSTGDGIELLEFLKETSRNNYEGFKRSTSDMNDIYKGQAIAIDGLITLFETATDKLAQIEQSKDKVKTEWI